MQAKDVIEAMNECGEQRCPFLFGLNFEMTEGFLVKQPLQESNILFQVNEIKNYLPAPAPAADFHLHIGSTGYESYKNKFDIAREGILRGDSFLLNLTEKTGIETSLSLKDIFLYSDSHYKLYLKDQFVCFSPECFVTIKDNEISAFPMKGTIDASVPDAEHILMDDYKEKCEHYTAVDLIRNDLCKISTEVRVKKFRYIDKVQTSSGCVLQTSSQVSGKLKDNWRSEVGTLLLSILPAGSICGAPKTATLNLIRKAEGEERGYYTGVFGYFDGENLDSGVLIRFIEKDSKDGSLYFRSGGGITVHSQIEEEYKEVREKIYLPIIKDK